MAMKTGMSIWNSRDFFQNVIEDVQIDTITQGRGIQWGPKDKVWDLRNTGCSVVKWRRGSLYRRLIRIW